MAKKNKSAKENFLGALSRANQTIKIHGARTHNLKNISLEIPRNQLVVLTGLSGSGKSSLAFDTIYAEAQRKYLENLSNDFGKGFYNKNTAEVDEIQGLSPAIAIDQKSVTRNVRSTVGTMTEIYDYLRLLFAKIGVPHCPTCGATLIKFSQYEIYNEILKIKKTNPAKLLILAPLGVSPAAKTFKNAKSEGFSKIKKGKYILSIDEYLSATKREADNENVYLVVEEIPAGITLETLTEKNCLKEIISAALKYGSGQVVVVANGKENLFPSRFYCEKCNFDLENLSPRMFSFNHPSGACPGCTGLGAVLKVSAELIIPNPKLSLAEGAIKPWRSSWTSWQGYYEKLRTISVRLDFSVDMPINKLSKKTLDVILCGEQSVENSKNSENKESVAGTPTEVWQGVIPLVETKYRETDSDFVKAEIEQYMIKCVCPDCEGKRLSKKSLAVRVAGKSIDEVVDMPIEVLYLYFEEQFKKLNSLIPAVKKTGKNCCAGDAVKDDVGSVVAPILKEIVARAKTITDINLGYLMLGRSSDTLSAGEAERLRLAAQIGATLSGILYVFDEPSIGLHPRDNEKIISMLIKLRDLGNSVLVVEHEDAFIRVADWIVDVGPGAGKAGGKIVAEGKLKEILKSDGFTGQYLAGKLKIERVRSNHTKLNKADCIAIYGAQEFNLKKVDIFIPLKKLVCFTGVSGSGKSTVVDDILGRYLSKYFYQAKAAVGKHDKILGLEKIKKVIRIDQNPIGRTPRSNAATYTGLFNQIREIFANTPEAKRLGYKIGHFSFNVKGGRCESCKGDGAKKIEMYFLSDVYAPCDECGGARYNEDTLKVRYKEKTIAEVLELSVSEALVFFSDDPVLVSQLNLLVKVGLGYLKLGQPATHLSGGEAQRIKLASELSRPEKQGSTLYILDEPTVGLHPEDVRNLLDVLSQLVERGNTVLLIEHNLDIIKNADWIIDMGPEGGERGGRIVAEGTPEMVAKAKGSYTGRFLKEVLTK